MELRPGCLTTGTPTWQDDDEVHRWLTGDVFDPIDACPILWLHGYWQRPASIVLNAGEYANAYRPGLYRKAFQRLWEQDHLVFVGFGFRDPQFSFMVREILRDIVGAHVPARHIALLGLELDADEHLPDSETIAEERANMEADYHVRPLLYRVKFLADGRQDHSELFTLLEGLAAVSTLYTPSIPSSNPIAMSAPFSSRWIHETTNDEKFTGREDERARLDRWAADPAVHVIGVCAVGGTGKTALIGDWLKNTTGWRNRAFIGLFAWSFYENNDSTAFLRVLLLWAHQTFGAPKPAEASGRISASLKLLRSHALVVVLDGLEVLQEGPEEARHGKFLDATLRELLGNLCARQHSSLAILTSRFVFADLERHLGTSFHQLELPGLSPGQGAALLADLEVRGSEADRADVSRRLEGHPLGLRVFAGAISESRRDLPREFLDEAFQTGALPAESPLAGKIQRLLAFYEKNLPRTQGRLLSIVALFRSPVAEQTILGLARGLFPKASDLLPIDAILVRELRTLQARGILSCSWLNSLQPGTPQLSRLSRLLKMFSMRSSSEPITVIRGYACHPILRDHFRGVLIGAGTATARRAADLLQGRPSEDQPHSVQELEPVLLAIELLLEAGEIVKADELFRGRLEDGRLFLYLPALLEGLHCTQSFVRVATRQWYYQGLSKARLGFYLAWVGLCASLSGHYELAIHFYAQAIAAASELKDQKNLTYCLQNKADLSALLGRLEEAADLANQSLKHARAIDDEPAIRNSLACRGWVRGLSGQVQSAAEDFASANALERKIDHRIGELYSLRGVRWAEILLRTGRTALARSRATANLRLCESHNWNSQAALCHLVLGACALTEGRLSEAENEILQAEPTFYSGQLLFDLAQLHITAGAIALARQDSAAALHRAAEALALAQPREMRLVHIDALILRGRARLMEFMRANSRLSGITVNGLARVLDDSEEAIVLARGCSYAWAERDALKLQANANAFLAKAYDATGDSSTAFRHHEISHRTSGEAENLAARLRITEEDLAAADARATAWLEELKSERIKRHNESQ